MSAENRQHFYAFTVQKYVFAFCIHPRQELQFRRGFLQANIEGGPERTRTAYLCNANAVFYPVNYWPSLDLPMRFSRRFLNRFSLNPPSLMNLFSKDCRNFFCK